MATRLGRLSLSITLGSGAFEESANKISRSFNRMVSRVRRESKVANVAIGGIVSGLRGITRTVQFAGRAIGVGLGVGIAAITTLVAAVKRATSELDDMGKAAVRAGTDAETLQIFERIGERGGANIQTTRVALQRLNRRIGDAATGNKSLIATFDLLGVRLYSADGSLRSMAEIIPDVAEGLARIDNKALRASLSAKLFDSEGLRLGLTLGQLGREGLAVAEAELRKFNLILSNETIKAAETAQDRFTLFGDALKTRVLAVLGRLSPALGRLAQSIATQLLPNVDAWAQRMGEAADEMLPKLVRGLGDFVSVAVVGFAKAVNLVISLSQAVVEGIRIIAREIDAIPGVDLELGPSRRELENLIKLRDRLREKLEGSGGRRSELFVGDQLNLERINREIADLEVSLAKVGGGNTFDRANDNLEGFRINVGKVADDIETLFDKVAAGVENAVGQPVPTTGAVPVGDGELAGIGNILDEGTIRSLQDRLNRRSLSNLKGIPAMLEAGRRKLEETKRELARAASEQMRRIMGFADTFANALSNAFSASTVKNGIKRLGDSLRTAVFNAALRGLALSLARQAVQLSGTGGFLGAIATGARTLFGFNKGGSFTVGGSGGADSQIVQFAATPGERVNVTPAGQGMQPIKFYNTVSFAGANIQAASNEDLLRVEQASRRGTLGTLTRLQHRGRVGRF